MPIYYIDLYFEIRANFSYGSLYISMGFFSKSKSNVTIPKLNIQIIPQITTHDKISIKIQNFVQYIIKTPVIYQFYICIKQNTSQT